MKPVALYGWNQIAEAMGVTRNTAQRLAREEGLPAKKAGGVFLRRDLLLEWLDGRPARPAPARHTPNQESRRIRRLARLFVRRGMGRR